MNDEADSLAALWLATLQTLTDGVAHDIRNRLNGVAVNLEVVRSRSARGGELADVAPFATAASTQFELLTDQVDALIALLRSPRPGQGVDVAAVLGRLVVLFGTRPEGGAIHVDAPLDGPGWTTRAPIFAVRLALAAALLAARASCPRVACRLGTEGPPTVYIECEADGPVDLPKDVAEVLGRTGVTLAATGRGIAISFPSSPPG